MLICVTGGSGFLGSYVTENLLKKGHKVRVLQHCISSHSQHLLKDYPEQLQICYGDVRNPSTCMEITAGVDGVIHLAAAIHVDESRNVPYEYWMHNVYGTFNMLEAVRQNKVPKILYMSSAEIYGNVVPLMANEDTPAKPSSPYAASKFCAERYTISCGLTYGMRYTIVRGFNFYGPRQKSGAKGAVIARWIEAALKNEDILVYGSGLQTRDYTYVVDTAEGVVSSFLSDKTDGEVLVLASGEEQVLLDIANKIIVKTDSKSQIKHVESRPGENMRSCGDSSKAFKLIGWKPVISFDEGLDMTITSSVIKKMSE